MTPKEVNKGGVSRPTLWKIKQKIKNKKKISLNGKIVKKVIFF